MTEPRLALVSELRNLARNSDPYTAQIMREAADLIQFGGPRVELTGGGPPASGGQTSILDARKPA